MFEDVTEFEPDRQQDKELHFFYNRDERIKNAPKIVQDYYADERTMLPARGFRALLTKQNRYIFFALIFFVGAAYIYSGFNRSRSYAKINGIDCELQTMLYGDDVFATLRIKRNIRTEDDAPRKIIADFSAIDVDKQVSATETLTDVYSEGEKTLHIKFTDYEIIRIDVIVTVDGEEKELSSILRR